VIPVGAELSSFVGSVEDGKGKTYSCSMSTQATEPCLVFFFVGTRHHRDIGQLLPPLALDAGEISVR
jgi:hypothetical protein